MFGFVVLSHRSPAQLLRLTRTISHLYGDPPIACHHDFSQAPLSRAEFPANVFFVEQSIRTAWGKWSLVEATLLALERLYQAADPDFFLSISAADYPVALPEDVLSDFETHDADAWIDSFDLHRALDGHVPTGEPELAHHRVPANIRLAQNLFLKAQLKLPIVRFKPPAHSNTVERYPRLGRHTIALPFDTWSGPFDRDYRCHVGSQWFSGRRSAARKLLNPNEKDRKLARHLETRPLPDGCYFQSVLCNDPAIRWCDRTFRLAFWNGGGAHPVDIDESYLPRLFREKPHFARKFQPDTPVLDHIDRQLGIARSRYAMA